MRDMIGTVDRFVGNCAFRDWRGGTLHCHEVKFWIKEGRAGFHVRDCDGNHTVKRSFDDPRAVAVLTEFIAAMRENQAMTRDKREDIAS